jgi:ketol-acid reductoisomerase
MAKLYYDNDADLGVLSGKTVAVFGYGSQGYAQSNNLRDSGVSVVLGLRPDGESAKKAKEDGFEVLDFPEAAAKADIIHFLLPDENHVPVYKRIKEHVTAGKTLSCSHGLNFHFELITAPEGVDIVMMAPKAPGPTVRREFVNGFGVPSLVAVHTDASGKAIQTALALAKGNGTTKVGSFETTFKDETETDLFGEQNVICGGAVYLMKMGFEVLTNAGYPPEIAYFECLHEMKLIVDLVYAGGVHGMSKKISNTARFGQFLQGPRVITDVAKTEMEAALKRIQDKTFVKEWIEKECWENNLENLNKSLAECYEWPIEQVGREIRKVAGLEEIVTGDEG